MHASEDLEDRVIENLDSTNAVVDKPTTITELTNKNETQIEFMDKTLEAAQTKENNNDDDDSCCNDEKSNIDEIETRKQSVEEIVGNILKQSQEFQRRLEKHQPFQQSQRNQSCLHSSLLKHNHRHNHNQRFAKSIDSSEEDDSDNCDGKTNNGFERSHLRFSRRQQCFVRAYNAHNQRSFRSQYDSFRNVDVADSEIICNNTSSITTRGLSSCRFGNQEKRLVTENLKKPNIVTGSKVIKTALRLRESCNLVSEEKNNNDEKNKEEKEPIYDTPVVSSEKIIKNNTGKIILYF